MSVVSEIAIFPLIGEINSSLCILKKVTQRAYTCASETK